MTAVERFRQHCREQAHRAELIAAALPASFTAPRAMDWDERVTVVTEVLAAAAQIDEAIAAGEVTLSGGAS
jgi:hypothetical protein